MQILNGKTYVDGDFVESVTVNVEGDKIASVGEASGKGEAIDATDCYVVPGFVDLHFHGCVGADLCDGEVSSIQKIAQFQASRGTTSICPATMTFSEEILTPIMESVNTFVDKQGSGEAPNDCANFVGVNMEGPYISPNKVGAQNPAYVHAGSIEEFRRLNCKSGNMIKLVDVAPEVEGNLSFIKQAVKEGVRISVAHTCANYDETVEAFKSGARQMTHLFNAMNPIHHRNPGPVVAACENEEVTAELICDGVHSHPAIIRMAFKLFGEERIILISDTMRACGMEDGTYDLGGQDVTVRGNLATIADGSIAGSVTCLPDCVRYAVNTAHIPLKSVIKCATENPARALGMCDKIGTLAQGSFADILILNKDLTLKSVILRGRKIQG